MFLSANDGRCDEVEALSRRLIAIGPDAPESYQWLANALVSQGRPLEGVRVALEQSEAREEPEEKAAAHHRHEAELAAGRGDFVTADAEARAWLDATHETNEVAHLLPMLFRMNVQLEAGQPSAVAEIGAMYLRQRWGWTPDASGIDPRVYVYRVLAQAGAMTPKDLHERRDEVVRAAPRTTPGDVWTDAYAALALTRADAVDALARLPAYLPLPPALDRNPFLEERIGTVYLRAGRYDEASRFLGRSGRACTLLSYPLEKIWSAERSGEALEALGDVAGACAAYAGVLAHWGAARPRSVTGEAAWRRSRALRCAATP
jgi:serine/threonine-protein kinase